MIEEEKHWISAFEDYMVSPLNGIRGKSAKRRNEYIQQEANIQEIFRTRHERQPLDFLKAISYRMPDHV